MAYAAASPHHSTDLAVRSRVRHHHLRRKRAPYAASLQYPHAHHYRGECLASPRAVPRAHAEGRHAYPERRRRRPLTHRRARGFYRDHRQREGQQSHHRALAPGTARRQAGWRCGPLHRSHAQLQCAALVPRRRGDRLHLAPWRRRRLHLVSAGGRTRRRGLSHRGRAWQSRVVARRQVHRVHRGTRAQGEADGEGTAHCPQRHHQAARRRALRRLPDHASALQAGWDVQLPAAPRSCPQATAVRRNLVWGHREAGHVAATQRRRLRVGPQRRVLRVRGKPARGRRPQSRSHHAHLRGARRRRHSGAGTRYPRWRECAGHLPRRHEARLPQHGGVERGDGAARGRHRRAGHRARRLAQPHRRVGTHRRSTLVDTRWPSHPLHRHRAGQRPRVRSAGRGWHRAPGDERRSRARRCIRVREWPVHGVQRYLTRGAGRRVRGRPHRYR